MNDKIVERRLRARRRFRQIVRQVIQNLHWIADIDDEKITENVQKNINIIYRKKTEKKLLSLADKSLLRKRAEWRTKEENYQLYKSIGGLKYCRNWPDHVKFKMVSRTYFLYFNAGRTIVKQNRPAEALYFILSGQVKIQVEVYDEVTETMTIQPVSVMGSGSIFGEVALLRKGNRLASVITLTPCELLVVYRDDFEQTLASTLKTTWDDIRTGLTDFSYFATLNENSKIECCLVASIREYKPNEIIYNGKPNQVINTYFILQGNCSLIELIYVRKKQVIASRFIFLPVGHKSLYF